MGKRKRNQQPKLADGQNGALPLPKKLKTSESTTQDVKPEVKQPKSKSLATTPKPKQNLAITPSKSTALEIPVTSGLSKAAAKRERHRKKLREAKKKPASGDGTEPKEATKQPEQQSAPKKEATTSEPARSKSKTVHRKSKKPHVKVRQSKSSCKAKSREPSHVTTGHSSKEPRPSDKQVNDLADQGVKDSNDVQDAAKRSKKQRDASKKPSSARQRRRQKVRMAKQAAALNDPEQPKTASDRGEVSIVKSASALSTERDPEVVANLFDAATTTHLLPRPVKQWIEHEALEDDQESADAIDPHVQTTPASDQRDSSKDQSSPIVRSLPAQVDSPSLPKMTPAATKNDIPESFVTVGVPPSNEAPAVTLTPTTRPGINSIASFSLSSRRQPASALSKHRTVSGLSSIRMDTGMIGSPPKPVNALKANSVPSSSGPGDAKAAFQRFQKFAHGGNSSESEDDSDDSESESDDEVTQSATHGAGSASQGKANASLLNNLERETDKSRNEVNETTTRMVATESEHSQVDNIAKDDASSSSDSSDSEAEATSDAGAVSEKTAPQIAHDDEAAAAQLVSDLNATAPDDGGDMMAPSPDEAPRMLGQKELPSFSAFNARHNINPTDTGVEHAANFLGSELGGGPSGSGYTDDKGGNANPLNIDYVASQDVDETFRSIDDITRELFGSIREAPDSVMA